MAFSGFKFCPSDEEIVGYYLRRKLDGLPIPPMTIQEHDDFFLDPHTLDWNPISYLKDRERYYFMKRTSTLTSDRGKGKKVRRSGSGDQSGFWRAAQVDKKIYGYQNQVCGLMTMLNFFLYSDQSTKIRKEAIKTRFIMHEYKLPTQTIFQEWVVCRVKNDAREPRIPRKPLALLDDPLLQPQLPPPLHHQQPPPPDQPMFQELVTVPHQQQIVPPEQPVMEPQQVEVVAAQQDQQQLQPKEDDFANALNGLLVASDFRAASYDFPIEVLDEILSYAVLKEKTTFLEEQEVPQKQLESTSFEEYEMIVKPPQQQEVVAYDDDVAERSPWHNKKPRVCESSSDPGPVQPPEPQNQPVNEEAEPVQPPEPQNQPANEEAEPQPEPESLAESRFVQYITEVVIF